MQPGKLAGVVFNYLIGAVRRPTLKVAGVFENLNRLAGHCFIAGDFY
jgi:hypothetical protein